MDKFLTRKQVLAATGISHSSLWNYETAGVFPARLQLGPNRVGWRASEVRQWMDSRPRSMIEPVPFQGSAKTG